VTHWYF